MEEIKQPIKHSTETTLQQSNEGTTVRSPRWFVPRSFMAYGLIILGLFLIAYSGYYFFLDSTLDNMFSEKPLPTQSVIASPTPDALANWKTYSNSDYGFSISFPSEIKVSPLAIPSSPDLKPIPTTFYISYSKSSNTSSGSGSFTITVSPGTEEEAKKEEENSQKTNVEIHKNRLDSITENIVSGKSVNRVTYSDPYQGKVITYIFFNNGLIYFIRASGEHLDILEKILPTFKFVDTTPARIKDNQMVCTLDAKLCPDGSSVGRTGPNCEFAPCPGS